MTTSIEIQKQKKREKRAEEIRDKFDDKLLSELDSDEPAAVRAALKIVNDRAFEKIEALQAEVEALKRAAGNTADFDTAIAAKNAAEAELETIKKEWSLTVNAEVRKVRDEVSTAHVALTQRELTIKRKEDMLKNSTEAALTMRAFDYLASLVRKITWEPKEFFDPEIPKSPWIWRIWLDEEKAKKYCAWEIELAAMPREKQVATIAYELHAHGCMICQHRSKYDLSSERRQFLAERAKYMDIENEVFKINREKTDVCRTQPHPMPARNVDYDFAHRHMLVKRAMQEGTMPSESELPAYLA